MSVVEVDLQEVRVIHPEVEAGAHLLDEIRPGWADKVDLDDFDIQDPDRCVLSYVYRTKWGSKLRGRPDGFALGAADLSEKGHSWMELGFCGKEKNDDWRLEIQARKTQ